MLKEAIAFKLIAAVVGAAFPAFRPRVIQGGRLHDAPAHPALQSPAPDVVDLEPIPLIGAKVSQAEAVSAFMEDMMEHACGEGLAFHRVKHSYVLMAPGRGWPLISDKALSQKMIDLGCSRRKVDLRAKGGGRRSEIVFPVSMAKSP